ncbi:MAG: hypothetical protein QM747_00950 [Nocardioides sp.]
MSRIWGAITGRSTPKQANLDSLFLVPSAAVTLQTAAGLTATGTGSVCFRAPDGAAYQQTQDEVVALLRDDTDKPDVSVHRDDFGFTWLVVDRVDDDVEGLCTDLHAVNASLEEQGFSTGLLCSLVPFRDASGRTVGLVYLYKQGTFYPFAPTGPNARDNLLEMQVRDTLKDELPMEQDLQRWLALWGAPGL